MTRRSITVPIVLLVIAAALIATTTQFTIMFNGPPPGPGPLPLARVAEAAVGLRDEGFLLDEDVVAILTTAATRN